MRARIVLAASLATAVVAAPVQSQELQHLPPAPLITVTPYAGYMISGNLAEGPLGTSLSSANSALFGAQAGVNLTRNLALVGNVARASGDLEVGVPLLGGLRVGSSALWLFDAGVQLRLPIEGRSLPIAPWVQVGAGAMHFDVQNSLVKTSATNAAFNAGVGADIDLTPNLGLRLMAKDYMGKFDFEQATQFDLVDARLSHNWALSAGLNLSF